MRCDRCQHTSRRPPLQRPDRMESEDGPWLHWVAVPLFLLFLAGTSSHEDKSVKSAGTRWGAAQNAGHRRRLTRNARGTWLADLNATDLRRAGLHHDVVLPGTLPAAARRTEGGTLQSGTGRMSCTGGGVERRCHLALFSEGVPPDNTSPTQALMEAGSGLSGFKPPSARTVSTVLTPAKAELGLIERTLHHDRGRYRSKGHSNAFPLCQGGEVHTALMVSKHHSGLMCSTRLAQCGAAKRRFPAAKDTDLIDWWQFSF